MRNNRHLLVSPFLQAKRLIILSLLVAVFFAVSSTAQVRVPSPQSGSNIGNTLQNQGVDVEALRRELRLLLAQELLTKSDNEEKPAKGKSAESRDDRLKRRIREITDEIQRRLLIGLQRYVDQKLGPQRPIELDTVPLEAVDKKGKVTEVPISVRMRPLRLLTEPEIAESTSEVLSAENFTLALYENFPPIVIPEDDEGFWRVYQDENARAIKTEVQLLVALKGGDWMETDGTRTVANAVAVRGLDLKLGLKPNGNQTYDDTLYVVIDGPDSITEVLEYRMTTESSSVRRGVGRLDSKQVTYVRGLHRGKDPGYKLKEESAPGTRVGLEGTFTIAGANIHSAYAKREIDSTTPLSPNVSLGCQVVAAGKKPFEQALVSVLDKKGVKEFLYTIVDGTELSILDTALAEKSKRSILVHGIPRT